MWQDLVGGGREMREDWYDTALICKNGHVITDLLKSNPENAVKFCKRCGAENVSACLICNEEIRGYRHMRGVVGFFGYTRPSFCVHCGKPYPWTEAALKAAAELSEESDELSREEKDILITSIGTVVQDSPEAPVAAARFRKLMAKVGKGTVEGFRSILVDVISETVKKTMFPS
jgi:hypothetical protein